MAKMHWADVMVKKIIAEKGDKKKYTIAAGITPSGTIHIGNFREIITGDLVRRALEKEGKKVRFILSWDEFEVFRKVPKNMPKQDLLKKYLRKPIVDVPDPFGKEESYARHHEVVMEKNVAKVGINPEFLYQAKKYRNLEYVDGIKIALQKREEIIKILNQFRKEPLAKDWFPLTGFCPKCGTDEISFSDYDGKNSVNMKCKCDFEEKVDITKAKYLKLPWRIDWPMRWKHEDVDFEPAGKEHYANPGGARITANETSKPIYGQEHPVDLKYDFITIKGTGGKMASSLGNVITLGDCLEIYEPEIIRWLFASTRPNSEFAISFDLDVLKIYEDFDKCERIYFGEQKAKDEEYQKRIYELSMVENTPKKLPYQPSFRHLTNNLQINGLDIEKTIEYYQNQLRNDEDKEKLKVRAVCAKNWIEKYAPEDFKFSINEKVSKVDKKFKALIEDVIKQLEKREWSDKELHEEFYVLMKKHDVDNKEFFGIMYGVLISKEKGPQLASFVLTIGRERVAALLKEAI